MTKCKKQEKQTYPNIDMQQTGAKMKRLLETAGYTPRMIQEYLHLSCVQPIYRWYKGLILPSVDHLLMLSELLGVHMEELLVKKTAVTPKYDMDVQEQLSSYKRYIAYYKNLYSSVAQLFGLTVQ